MSKHGRLDTVRRTTVALIGTVLLIAVVAGCGGGGSPATSQSTPPTSTPSTSAPTTTPAVAIRQVWTTFFNGKTSAARKIALLENGSSVAKTIDAQASSGLATSTAALVSSVHVDSPRQATVRYSITLGGTPALTNQRGLAVKVGGHWLVSLSSFCALLNLEGNPPQACTK